jgi:uncharacterized protein
MTDVTPRISADALIIQSYTPQGFRVSGKDYGGAILIAGGQVLPVSVTVPSQLGYEHIKPLKGLEITYLIIGCGTKSVMPPLLLLQDLKHMGIVAEAMSTGAACRTYNVLLAEQRPVAALLLPG